MVKKIWGVGFYVLIAGAVIAMFIMAYTVHVVRAENSQLQQDKEELRLELVDTQIQRDETVDAVWSNNHRQMMENAD